MDKKKFSSSFNLFGTQNQMATPVEQIQSSLEKKAMKLKELRKRGKGYKKKSREDMDMDMVLVVVDVKVLSRVLRITKISKEQLFWCEEKMKKLVIADGKLQRDPVPLIFPC